MFLYSVPGPVPPTDAPELDEATKHRLAALAAMRTIAAQSKAIDASGKTEEMGEPIPAPLAVAPPGFVPDAAPVERAATPPPGYSFTKHREVARAQLPADIVPGPVVPPGPPAWMASGSDDVAALAAAGRGWAYGWVKLAANAEAGDVGAVLAAAGGELLGGSGDMFRARLPADGARLVAVAEDPAIAGLGATPPARKMRASLVARAQDSPHERTPVWITLMDADRDGRWRRALADLGAEVGAFHPAVRAYAATVELGDLARVVAADYVLAVETIGRVAPMLELAGPAMGTDSVRVFDESAGTFVGVGGASVPVGVVDTGLNVSHPDISSGRRSICGANFVGVGDGRLDDQDLWFDADGHGTHVTGIAVGNGSAVQASGSVRAGMAPLVRDIRFAKGASIYGPASALVWVRAIDWLGTASSCTDDDPRKPLVLNSSLAVQREFWEGRSVVERKIDATVWAKRQLLVSAAGNGGTSVIGSMASAKNALSVGAAYNIGDVVFFSSRGPTGDGRLLPNVVGTGVGVLAAAGGGRRAGYANLSGTSMSSPAVAGIAALVMDAVPELREEPAAVRARLMASAIKPDAFMGNDRAFSLDNTEGPGRTQDAYGLGRVSARTAVLDRDADDGWTGGTAAFEATEGDPYYVDVVVPEGASRLDVVLTWDEPPAETIANTVLHDLDLYVTRHEVRAQDLKPVASKSRIDNVEWTILREPPAGTYRLSVLPRRVYGTPPRVGLAWTVIRGRSTPALAVAADRERIEVAPGEPFDVEVTLSADSYVATGANLRIDCREEPGSGACAGLSYIAEASTVGGGDAQVRSLARDGEIVVVGEVAPGDERTVKLRYRGKSASGFQLYFAASAWNATSDATSVAVAVGGSVVPPRVERPPNDDFATPEVLDGAEGETTFDLVAATPGPGEPNLVGFGAASFPGRHRSLWYEWTAPESGPIRFAVMPAMANDYADNVVVQAFADGPVAALGGIGDGFLGGGTTFFAERGRTYRVRLAIPQSALAGALLPRLALRWIPGGRPDNDQYAHGAVVSGEVGRIEGHNMGATTEPAELEGPGSADFLSFVTNWLMEGWTSSVWYRWTAPSSGEYRFSVDRRAMTLAVFSGDDVGEARLVSSLPRQGSVVVPAAEGVDYRIGVATRNSYYSGSVFNLSWASGRRISAANDDMANAAPVATSQTVQFYDLTVEHGEADETGVRTAWWAWTPPSAGRYTWRITRRTQAEPGVPDWQLGIPLQFSAFAVEDRGGLRLLAAEPSEETASFETAFDVPDALPVRLAVGLPRQAALVPIPAQHLAMALGPTPANDDVANATPLAGASGSVWATNRFATTERGERTGSLGDSSLWWRFEPEETGWMMFEVTPNPGAVIAIYRVGEDGGRALVATSQQMDTRKVQFLAVAGTRYLVRYGTTFFDFNSNGARSDGFKMEWQPTGPPAAVGYVDLVDDTYAANGERFYTGVPYDQVLNADGTELYLGSSEGIFAFGRDAATGRLSFLEKVTELSIWHDHHLVWDESGAALIVATCGEPWRKFAARDGGGLRPEGDVDGAPCLDWRQGRVLVLGDFLLHVTSYSIETYRFDAERSALTGVGIVTFNDIEGAAPTADGRHVYVLGSSELIVLERDPDDGGLAYASVVTEGFPPYPDDLAVNDSHLFVTAGVHARTVAAFDIDDPANPAYVGQASVPGSPSQFVVDPTSCRSPIARPGAAAVDLWCLDLPNSGIASLRGERSGLFHMTGLTRVGDEDSLGNAVPFMFVRSVVASPDGRHLYMAGFRNLSTRPGESASPGIVLFERLLGLSPEG